MADEFTYEIMFEFIDFKLILIQVQICFNASPTAAVLLLLVAHLRVEYLSQTDKITGTPYQRCHINDTIPKTHDVYLRQPILAPHK